MAPGSSPVRLGCALLLMLMLCSAPSVQSQRLAGGRQKVPVSDPGAQDAATFAMDAYNRGSNSLNYYKLLRVLKAEAQVVSGLKYFLTVELVKTQCEKRGNSGLKHVDLERCAVSPEDEQQKLLCEFQVWSRPWLHETELVHMKCQPSRS